MLENLRKEEFYWSVRNTV